MKHKLILTMVLPAPNGCNSGCAFCGIRQRGETGKTILKNIDYTNFLRDVAERIPITRFSIQGVEPLLPEVLPLTKKLLQIAEKEFNLPRTMVTNGIHLSECAGELSGFVDTLTVSLDSHKPIIHNRLRDAPGAWKKVTMGIRKAAKYYFRDKRGYYLSYPNDPPCTDVVVHSVLFQGKGSYVTGIPALLADLKIVNWVVSPVANFKTGELGMSLDELRQTLGVCQKLAKESNIQLTLSDEFGRFDKNDFDSDLKVDQPKQGEFIVRLSPDGTCSRGLEITKSSATVPVWDCAEDADVFLRRILEEIGVDV